MQWYDQIKRIKVLLIIIAVIIAVISLVASHLLVRDLAEGERKNMEVWAQAMRTLNNADQNTDVTLVLEVLNGNNTIPVIVLDSAGYVQSYRNLQISADNLPDSLDRIRRMADHMKTDGKVIRMELSSPDTLNTSLFAKNGMDWMYANCSTTAQRGALDWMGPFHDAIKPVVQKLYQSVKSGNEAQISIDSNSKPDYREKLEAELKALRESEMWQTAVTVRKLRPENN